MKSILQSSVVVLVCVLLVDAAQAAPVVNVGLGGKSTIASPQNWGGSAANAVDGNTGGNSWVHSATNTTNFWEIDLGGTIPLDSFTVYARGGLLGRINGSTISFLDHAGATVGSHTVSVSGGLTDGDSFNVPLLTRTVRIDKTGDYLNFMEIELFAENFALGVATSQSSSWGGGYSATGVEATDGNLGNETHTAAGDALPTLTVDLGKDAYSIDSIVIHNRDDCCGDRLSDLVVEVLDGSMAVVQSAAMNPGNALGSPATLGVDFHELFGGPTTGQFVRISKTGGTGGLYLAAGEVQVFGQDNDNPPPVALAFQEATAYRSQSGLEVGFAVDGLVGSGFGTGWGDNAGPDDNIAVFETTSDVDAGEQTLFTFDLDHQSFGGHAIGKFRISATTADRSQFADGQANNGQLGDASIWTPVQVLDAQSSGGSWFALQPDGSLLVTGPNPTNDIYTVKALTDLQGITGIRLEALQDPALPSSGPGRPPNGNFVLTEFSALAEQVPDVLPVGLQNPTADKSQSGWEIGRALSPDSAGWAAVNPGPVATPQTAAFETMVDAGIDGGTLLTFSLDQFGSSQHGIGNFRLAVTTADRSQFADGLANGGDLGDPSIWTVLRPIDVTSSGGSTMTVEADNSVLASGANPGSDLYTVRAVTDLTGITGVRLETLGNPPGRYPGSNGNYILSHFTLDQTDLSQPVSVGLQTATADKSQAGWEIGKALTPDSAGWAAIATGDPVATPQTAAFETMGDIGFDGGTTLTFNLDQFGSSQHAIGKFRIAVTTADRDQFADGLANGGDLGDPAIWTELIPLSMMSSGNATVAIGLDNTVTLSGANPTSDTYTFTANTPLTGITGVRLETLGNPPGRYTGGNGNYILSHFTATESPLGTEPVNVAQSAGVTVVGVSSYNSPQLINDGVLTDDVTTAAFTMPIAPPTPPQGLGYDLGGHANLDSVRIYQHSAVGGSGGRRRLESLTVHTSQGPVTFSGLPDQDVIDLDLSGINTSYVFVQPGDQYPGSDPRLGLREIQVFTRDMGIEAWENLALGTAVRLEGSGWNAGAGSPEMITDGAMAWGPDHGNYSTGVFNNQIQNGAVVLDLGDSMELSTLGIVQQTYGGGGARRMIEDVLLEFSNDDFATVHATRDITLADGVVYQQIGFTTAIGQYVRFSPLTQYGTGSDANIGIVELQLFHVPEPSTMILAALGLIGLVFFARRRR